jgi:uncharacterized protein YyaL (SSP411 family)
VIVLVDPLEQASLAAQMPWVAGMKMIDDKATAYVCRGFVCSAPSTDPGVFLALRSSERSEGGS